MGHTIIIAAGVVVNLDPTNTGDMDQVEETFEENFQTLKNTTRNRISTYFSEYMIDSNEFFFLRGMEGYDSTNKAYLFPTVSLIWSTSVDGSSAAYFHENDGLNDPIAFTNKIQEAQEQAQTLLVPLVHKLGLEEGQWKVEIIRYSATYE
jgi:hypothetical protein